MGKFHRVKYREEMLGMVRQGVDSFLQRQPGVEVFTVSIWTDVDAAASAISFDTFEQSMSRLDEQKAYARHMQQATLAEGKDRRAELWSAFLKADRDTNPADFHFRNYATCRHRSLPRHWEEQSKGKCWQDLTPVLEEVAQLALPILANLRLHDKAELGVNGPKDWFQARFPLYS